jgi:hypothetical protein
LPDKCLLVRGELHFHRLQRRGRESEWSSRCGGLELAGAEGAEILGAEFVAA